MSNNDRTSGYTDAEAQALFEEFVSKPGKSAREWLEDLGDSGDEWIIPGLVCDSLTIIYGKPESGKSTLAVNIAAALSNGSSVFGASPRSGETPQKILIVGTEANTRQEYPRRLERAGANMDNACLEYAGDGRFSRESVIRAEHGGIDLVVVDNVQGLTDGNDTVDSATAKLVYDKVRPFIDAMVPVILIHHASTAHRDSARGNRMSGNTQFEAMARWHVEVQKENGSDRRLLGSGNMDTPHTFQVRVDDDLVMSLRDAPVPEDKPEDKPKRSAVTMDRRAEVWAMAPTVQESTVSGVAREIEDRTGYSMHTVRGDLSKGVKAGKLVKAEGQSPLYRAVEH